MSVLSTALLGMSPYISQAATSNEQNTIDARKQYEQNKEQITHASEYINRNQSQGERQTLLQVESKHSDAINVKVEGNNDK
ncbi:hypothetical protein M1D72_12225 [Vibrio sp. AK197]